MKVLGIGNAIVDVICKVEENFIEQNNLIKGTMKLFFDDKDFKNLFSNLKIEKTISGGSVANSIVGLSQLNNKVGFIGKISNDNLGMKYEEGLKSENVEFFYQKKNELVFLEGYLWDEGEPKKAFEKAIKNSKKVAMSLSDQFCVDRHKPQFLDLVKNKLDITFANEQEIISLINAKTFDEVINFGKNLRKLLVITRGEKGAISIFGDNIYENKATPNLEIKDLTGAGDLFAAGYLHGYINQLNQLECLNEGKNMSSKIIQQIGARL